MHIHVVVADVFRWFPTVSAVCPENAEISSDQQNFGVPSMDYHAQLRVTMENNTLTLNTSVGCCGIGCHSAILSFLGRWHNQQPWFSNYKLCSFVDWPPVLSPGLEFAGQSLWSLTWMDKWFIQWQRWPSALNCLSQMISWWKMGGLWPMPRGSRSKEYELGVHFASCIANDFGFPVFDVFLVLLRLGFWRCFLFGTGFIVWSVWFGVSWLASVCCLLMCVSCRFSMG